MLSGNYDPRIDINNVTGSCGRELDVLIALLKKKIKSRDPSIKGIKYPKLLLKSLMELNGMVGMERLKDSISLQIMRLISALNTGEKNNSMLNTILYGPPGVGKTKVGIILAKIWFALGFLQGNISESSNESASNVDNSLNTQLVITIIFIVLWFMTYIIQAGSFVYKKLGLYWLMAILGGLILLGLFIYWSGAISKLMRKDNNYSPELIRKVEKGQIDERHIITVVSRRDFVADYVGQTAGKTKRLLMSNIGKVLFIDEAYSLLNDSRDPFGLEALTAINLFMSENPGSIVVIFAGYKDLMQNGIFKAQPGLPRRCMWHFECDGYDGLQLSEIFFRQVAVKGWEIENKQAAAALIQQHSNLFPSFGGDTERLVFFSQLEASRNEFLSTSSTPSTTLTIDHIKNGIERLKQNNIHSDPKPQNTDHNLLSSLISSLSQQQRSQTENSNETSCISNTKSNSRYTDLNNLDISC